MIKEVTNLEEAQLFQFSTNTILFKNKQINKFFNYAINQKILTIMSNRFKKNLNQHLELNSIHLNLNHKIDRTEFMFQLSIAKSKFMN